MAEADRPLVRATEDDLNALFADILLPVVRNQLAVAGLAQRFRVTTLPMAVTNRVCADLQGDPRWVARAIVAAHPTALWEATATKLIELRNTLSGPLLVFVPPGLRVTAEDSLDVATFTELSLADLGDDARAALTDRLRAAVRDIIEFCETERVVQNSD